LGKALKNWPAVAEGELSFTDRKWRLKGTLRPLDPLGKDSGTCTVQGEVVETGLRSGSTTFTLTGPAAKDAKGRVRATGTLRLGKGGEATLEATKVEPVKD
jgi:hypothetical protein